VVPVTEFEELVVCGPPDVNLATTDRVYAVSGTKFVSV